MDIDVITKQSRQTHAAMTRYRPMLEDLYVHWALEQAQRHLKSKTDAYSAHPTPETEADARAAKVLLHAHNIAALISPPLHE